MWRFAAVALVGLVLGSALVVRNLATVDWDVTLFTAFGRENTRTLEYGQRLLGDVYERELQGHDGKFFFIQANDPFLLHPDEHAIFLDRPLYRAQRMLFPTLAGGFGLLPPHVIVWAMVVVNVAALAAGSGATALVARHMGGSPWWGLAFGLNPGLLNELLVGGAGIVATAAAMAAVAAFHRDATPWGVTGAVLAVLSREVMLLSVVGMAWWAWSSGRRDRVKWILGVPFAAVAIWALYVRARIGWSDGATQVQEVGLPLTGFVRSLEAWIDRPLGLAVGCFVLVLVAAFTIRMAKRPALVGWAAAGFAPLTLLLTTQVWLNDFDITRAVAPLITAYVLLAFATSGKAGGREDRIPRALQGTASNMRSPKT